MKVEERKKIKAEAKSKVSEVLAQEDQAKMQAKLDELFNDVLTELAEAKADKDKAVEDNTKLSETLETLKAERDLVERSKEDLEAKASELQKKLEDADEKISALEAEFDSMKQEAALRARLTILEEADLIHSGKAAEKQLSRVKSMDDDTFTEYVSELSELKATWVKKAVEEAAGAAQEKEESAPVEDSKKTAASLKALAALNVSSSKDVLMDTDTMKRYESMWNEE